MADITRKEQTNVVTDITECATVTKNSIDCAAVIYVILEQYITCSRNVKHCGAILMTHIVA